MSDERDTFPDRGIRCGAEWDWIGLKIGPEGESIVYGQDVPGAAEPTCRSYLNRFGKRLRAMQRELGHEIVLRPGLSQHEYFREALFAMFASDSCPDAFFVKDRKLKYVYVNRAMRALLELDENKILGRTDNELFPPKLANELTDLCRKALAGRLITKETTRTFKSEARRYVEIYVATASAQDYPTGVYGVLREMGEGAHEPAQAVSKSRAYQDAYEKCVRAAETSIPVLLTGESGVGKDFIARTIHDHSAVKAGPFQNINMAALPSELIDSELFGHEKGAFTGAVSRKRGKFELADGGTLFLNEIGDITLQTQARLLSYLDTLAFQRVGGVKDISPTVRLIYATNKDLNAEVEKGRFRLDLLYRISTYVVHIPALRERKEDIPGLVRTLLDALTEKRSQESVGIEPAALRRLQEYDWPGNVRELRSAMERADVRARGSRLIKSEHIDFGTITADAPVAGNPDAEETAPEIITELLEKKGSGKQVVPTVTQILCLKSLKDEHPATWSQARIAQRLGVTPASVSTWLKRVKEAENQSEPE